jgi:hypothetical protein
MLRQKSMQKISHMGYVPPFYKALANDEKKEGHMRRDVAVVT